MYWVFLILIVIYVLFNSPPFEGCYHIPRCLLMCTQILKTILQGNWCRQSGRSTIMWYGYILDQLKKIQGCRSKPQRQGREISGIGRGCCCNYEFCCHFCTRALDFMRLWLKTYQFNFFFIYTWNILYQIWVKGWGIWVYGIESLFSF